MQPHTVPVPLVIQCINPPPKTLAEIRCLECDVRLTWHQPDPGLPDRMLGICVECGSWHLVHTTTDATDAVVVLLPDAWYLGTL